MRCTDTRPPFAGLHGKELDALLAALPSPCYLLDEARLRRNGEILLGVQQRTGCKILLAQKAFSNFGCYPVLASNDFTDFSSLIISPIFNFQVTINTCLIQNFC